MPNNDTDGSVESVAGNGLLHRRLFLANGAALLGTGGIGLLTAHPVGAEPLTIPPWMKAPGAHMSAYGQPSRFEADVQRVVGALASIREVSRVLFLERTR